MTRGLLVLGSTLLAVCPAFSFAQTPAPDSHARIVRGVALGAGSFLGVAVQEIDAERAKDLKLKDEAGVEVTRIEEDSPASKSGLKVGDVILSYNGQKVEGMEQFSRMVRETPAGREVRIAISRDGNPQTIAARVGSRKGMTFGTGVTAMPANNLEWFSMPDIPQTLLMWRSGMLGIEGEALRGQLAGYFGV